MRISGLCACDGRGREHDMTVRAYINVYVDDILYVGEMNVMEALQTWLTSEWKASELSWVSEE